MFLLTLLLITPAHATNTCSLQDLNIDRTRLMQFAVASIGLTAPKLFFTEENPVFAPDNPTKYWALPTTGNTVTVKVHHADLSSETASVAVVWTDTVLTINPAAKSVSGTVECDALLPITEHVLNMLHVIQEPAAP